jgi:hypothetical protein
MSAAYAAVCCDRMNGAVSLDYLSDRLLQDAALTLSPSFRAPLFSFLRESFLSSVMLLSSFLVMDEACAEQLSRDHC